VLLDGSRVNCEKTRDLGLSVEAKQAECVYWCTPGCTVILVTVSGINLPSELSKDPPTMASFSRPVLFFGNC